jgi:COP9 signalosome complex subunit 4
MLMPFPHRNQRDRITSYQTLLASLLTPPVSSPNLITFGRHFTTSTSMALVVGRRVLGAFVIALSAGSGLEPKYYRGAEGEEAGGDEARWEELGAKGFEGEEGGERRREVVEGVLGGSGAAGWCDEQVSRTPRTKTIHSLCVNSSPSLTVIDNHTSSA